MDNSLADLDILLTRVRDSRSRVYLSDALKAYRAGALRPAVTAIWVTVAFDLISKYRELAGLGDAEARTFVEGWDRARNATNVQQLTRLERELLKHAANRLQLFEPIGLRDLQRLQSDRHLCAHPAYSTEAELFQPSAELVRLHFVNAIELVLSQRPVQGRTILSEFDRDVVSPGFPTDPVQIADYLEQRYFARTRPSLISNFGSVLAKALLRNDPADWIPVKDKLECCLSCIHDRRQGEWATVETDIVRFINELDPDLSLNALRLLTRFPGILARIDAPTITVIQQCISNFDPDVSSDFSMFRAITIEQFRPALLALMEDFDEDHFVNVIRSSPNLEFWPAALGRYSASGSFRGAEGNFRQCISPFEQIVGEEELAALLEVIPQNNQIYDAARTPVQLLEFLNEASQRALPTLPARTAFYTALQAQSDWLVDSYDIVWEFMSSDGWQRP